MTTYRRLLYHIVFATRGRRATLPDASRDDLYRYIWGICKDTGCTLLRAGGTGDHVHLLLDVPPTTAVADAVRTIKANSSRWMRRDERFSRFDHWQEGYGVFTVSFGHKDAVIEYIRNQEDHHKAVGFLDEYRALLAEMGLTMDEVHLP